MGEIVTYKEGHFSQVKLASGERILFSIAQSGIVIFKLHFFGLIPGPKVAEWLPQDLDRFVDLFGGASPDQNPFRFAVDKLASFGSIKDIRAYLMQRH